MAIILFIPHVLVILDLLPYLPRLLILFLLQRQADQTIHRHLPPQLPHQLRAVLLLQLEHDLSGRLFVFDDLGLQGARRGEDHWDPVPLAGDLVARVAVGPGVVVDGLGRVDAHVGFGGAAGVERADGLYDGVVSGRDLEGARGLRLVVNGLVGRDVARGNLGVWVGFVLVVELFSGRHDDNEEESVKGTVREGVHGAWD